MDALELIAKLKLDISEYESGLDTAKTTAEKGGSKIGGALRSAAKIGVAALATASAAAVGFAGTSVKAGMDFDSSMSQVAATMGTTVDQIQELRDFAQEMGRTTAFSATQSAEALNYMALAGYDAETSMEMLPNVLNLAAAGSMELASASDMVTDAQSALGLSIEETNVMVDQMAKASSKSNTSVSQLGEAILTIGATASNMAGGTQELTTVLGALADNGIKGAEGGTHLRNMILSLQNPTDEAAATLENLGIAVYDSEGNMRSMVDIIEDLQTATNGLDQQSKDAITTGIFNKTDLAAVNALLNTSTERFDELTEAIGDSEGAAEDMANTQLDNLAGDITLFKSALEGAQIAVSDGLTPTLREFVQFGTDGLSELTSAFQEGGLAGAMGKLGELLSDAISMLTEKLPDIANAGVELLSALTSGIIDNLPALAEAAMTIITNLGEKLAEAAPKIGPAIGEVISKLAELLVKNIPTIISLGTEILVGFVQGISQALPVLVTAIPMIVNSLLQQLPVIIEAGCQILIALVNGILEALPLLIEALPEVIDTIINVLLESAPILMEASVVMLMAIVEALPDIISALSDALPKLIQTVVNFLTGKGMSQILSASILMFKAIVYAIPQILSATLQALAVLMVSVMNGIASYASQMLEAAKNLFSNIVSGINEKASDVLNAIRTKVSEWINAIKSTVGQWREAGANLLTGLWNGISDKVQWVYNNIRNFGGQVLAKLKAALHEESPSKATKEMGKFLAEGLGIGWEDEIKKVNEQIGKDVNYKGSIDVSTSASGLTTTSAVTASNMQRWLDDMPINLYITNEVDGKKLNENSYTYTVGRMRRETDAVRIAHGGA